MSERHKVDLNTSHVTGKLTTLCGLESDARDENGNQIEIVWWHGANLCLTCVKIDGQLTPYVGDNA